MAWPAGTVRILKLSGKVQGDTEHTGQRYTDVTENFRGSRYNSPTMVGSFVEVEVMRSFAVKTVPTFQMFELDKKENE